MDRRLAERRRRVAEDRARSNLGRLVRVLVVLAVVAGAVWFAQSPFMSVSEIRVVRDGSGGPIDVQAILEENGIREGRPMLLIDVDAAESAFGRDPWVRAAAVARDWPTTVVVELQERTPAVALRLEGEWWRAAEDGVLLENVTERPPGLPVATFDDLPADDTDHELLIEGAVEFLTGLPGRHRGTASVTEVAQGMEATVAGFEIRLGRPFEMGEKASVVAAMLESDIEEGSILTVVAPASPAVLPPNADQSGDQADQAGDQAANGDTAPTDTSEP